MAQTGADPPNHYLRARRFHRCGQQTTGRQYADETLLRVNGEEIDDAFAYAFAPNLVERLGYARAGLKERKIFASMNDNERIEIGTGACLTHPSPFTRWTIPLLRKISAASLK